MATKFNYAKMQATANRLFDKFTQGEVFLVKKTTGEDDPDNPWTQPPEETRKYLLDATVSPVSTRFVNGETIITSDKEVKFGTEHQLVEIGGVPVDPVIESLEIAPADTIFVDGKETTIIEVRRVPAAGLAIAWIVIVRF